MEIRSESRIAHPVDAVFRAYRDHLPAAAKFIPDVKGVVVRARREEGPRVILHNEWASDREIPAVAAGLIKPEHLRWDDFATWDETTRVGTWEIKPRAFTDKVHCAGRTAIVADGPRHTKVLLTGEFRVDITEIPGVPGFLARRVGPQVEKFIVALITPNLEQTNQGIAAWLDRNPGDAR